MWGRQVTHQGRSYIWDGSAWKNDSDYIEIGGRNLIISNSIQKGRFIQADGSVVASGSGANISDFIELSGDTYTFSGVSPLTSTTTYRVI